MKTDLSKVPTYVLISIREKWSRPLKTREWNNDLWTICGLCTWINNTCSEAVCDNCPVIGWCTHGCLEESRLHIQYHTDPISGKVDMDGWLRDVELFVDLVNAELAIRTDRVK